MIAGIIITDRVAEMHAALAKEPPNEVMAAFGQEQATLAATGVPAGVARPGTRIADTELLDVHGAWTSLYKTTGDSTAVLVFYRGVWCPYCNLALSAYQQHLLAALTERAVRLVAISPQAADGSLSMQEKHDLAFTVLSDPGNHIARGLGILTHPTDAARAAQLELGLDLTAVNADGTTSLPMPTVRFSTPVMSCGGLTCTPTTAPAPSRLRSSEHSTSSPTHQSDVSAHRRKDSRQ